MAHDYDQLVSQVATEWMFASPNFLNLELAADAALTLLGSIQLCLRHPGFGGAACDLLISIAETIETQLASLGPATREICRQGWDPSHDSDAA